MKKKYSISSIEGRTPFAMPRGANWSLAFNEPKWVALHSFSKSKDTSEHEPQVERAPTTDVKSHRAKMIALVIYM